MTKCVQFSVSFPTEHQTALERMSAQTGRSIASFVREAVHQYLLTTPGAPSTGLTPDALWALLRTPEHWATFKQIAIEMESRPFTGEPVAPPPPKGPSWKYNRPAGVTPRTPPPPAELPPF